MKARRGRGENTEPRNWQNELRSKLERGAFSDKYPCIRCGSKKNINVHHLLYTGDKEDFFDPRFWVPLCQECHGFAHSKEYVALLSGGEIRCSGWSPRLKAHFFPAQSHPCELEKKKSNRMIRTTGEQ